MWGRTLLTRQTLKLVKRQCSTVAEKQPEKKEALMEKWKTYWKGVWRDYTTVAKEVVEDAKNRPLKATAILSTFSAATYCAIHNPDETSFTDQLLSSSAELGMVTPYMQNKESAMHILFLRNERNERRLKRFSFLVFSLMIIDDNCDKCSTYESACKYLGTPLQQFFSQVVDFGFLDRWWILHRYMENYDVNDE